MPEVGSDARRWSRLQISDLCRSRLQLLTSKGPIVLDLADLGPAGIGFLMRRTGPMPVLEPGQVVRLRLRFDGGRWVRLRGEVRHVRSAAGGAVRAGVEFSSGVFSRDGSSDRRGFPRLTIPADLPLLARIPLPHAHRVWCRCQVVNVSADLGFQVQSQGGPIYLLPGMEADLHLDLPLVHEKAMRCQVLWSRSQPDGSVRVGLRGLDLSEDFQLILEEWLSLSRRWSPEALRALGFSAREFPGQFRFRRAQTSFDYEAVQTLRQKGGALRRTGLELSAMPDDSSDLLVFGGWDQSRLVVAAALDLRPSRVDGAFGRQAARLCGTAFEPAWFGGTLFKGFWEQTVRHFLSTGLERLWVWCPGGRYALCRRLGLAPVEDGPEPLDPMGQWMVLPRNRILQGRGMSLVSWYSLYAGVSGFSLKQGMNPQRWRQSLSLRPLRFLLGFLLDDTTRPGFERRLDAELQNWTREVWDVR